jgi:DNA processing protein
VGREHFLVRNRLIAALSAGVVVVEAPARSGALATARRAAMMGLPVMAVPGPVTSAVSVGCHLLLREYAAVPVTCVEDVMEVVGDMGEQLSAWPQGPRSARDGLSVEQRRMLDAADPRRPMTLGALARAAGVHRAADARKCLAPLLARGLLAEIAGEPDGASGYRLTQRGVEDGSDRLGV